MILILKESTISIPVLGRGRNKFENLCPIPLKKDSIKYVQTISILGYKMECLCHGDRNTSTTIHVKHWIQMLGFD